MSKWILFVAVSLSGAATGGPPGHSNAGGLPACNADLDVCEEEAAFFHELVHAGLEGIGEVEAELDVLITELGCSADDGAADDDSTGSVADTLSSGADAGVDTTTDGGDADGDVEGRIRRACRSANKARARAVRTGGSMTYEASDYP